jgi:hypothetical protein
MPAGVRFQDKGNRTQGFRITTKITKEGRVELPGRMDWPGFMAGMYRRLG